MATSAPSSVEAAAFKEKQRVLWGASASSYAANIQDGSAVMMPVIKELVSTVVVLLGQAPPGLAILDVASGSGEPALSLAKAFPDAVITATDLAPEMVAEGVRRAADQGLGDRIRWAVADAEDLSSFATSSLDLVTCNCSLWLMPHYDRALDEFHRVLKPAGLLVATTWSTKLEETDIAALMIGTAVAMSSDAALPQNPNRIADKEQFVNAFSAAGFQDVKSRQFNCPALIAAQHLRGALIDSAVLCDLWTRLEAEGRNNVKLYAEQALQRVAADQGWLQPDGSVVCPTNIAVLVTAWASGSK
ncbi:hypothetical protein WJX72_009647 [[Myrmecia] bisecta]|uniref:Methyltransferase domain-containing protein n=1 Tax=[Myrmecia] bisecta TaxID=41462 RepID=A0AAW1PXD8_9CHLO